MVETAHPGTADLGALRLIEAITVGLPKVKNGAIDRLARGRRYLTNDKTRNAGGVHSHIAAVGHWRSVSNVERTLDGSRRGLARLPVIDRIDQHADAEHVGHQDEFLTLFVTQLAGARQKIDRDGPFFLRRFNHADESVGVFDHRLHHLLQPRIRDVAPAFAHHIGQVAFCHVRHRRLLGSLVSYRPAISYRTMAAPSAIALILPNATGRGRYFMPQSGATTTRSAGTWASARRMRSATT